MEENQVQNNVKLETAVTPQVQADDGRDSQIWLAPEAFVVIDVSVRDDHTCDLCGTSFPKASALERHKIVHTGAKIFRCSTCGKDFKHQHVLKNHMRLHTGDKPFECDICGRRFTESGHLGKHKRTHLGVKSYVCKICGKGFTQGSGLYQHTRVVHNTEKAFQCEICGRQSARGADHAKHMKIHSSEKQFKCLVCGKFFPGQEQLAAHKLVHSIPKPFPCDLCDREFRHEGALRNHKELNRCTMRRYQCKACKAGFTSRERLQEHRLLHKDSVKEEKRIDKETSHNCELCGQAFVSAQDLQRHMFIHDPLISHMCEVCGFLCQNLPEFELHKKTHFTVDSTENADSPKSTGDTLPHEEQCSNKMFTCKICGKTFAKMRGRNAHMKTHSETENHFCNICGKSFLTNHRLKLHKMFHANVAQSDVAHPNSTHSAEEHTDSVLQCIDALISIKDENQCGSRRDTEMRNESDRTDESHKEQPAQVQKSGEPEANSQEQVEQVVLHSANIGESCTSDGAKVELKLDQLWGQEQASSVGFGTATNGTEQILINSGQSRVMLEVVQNGKEEMDSGESCLKFEIRSIRIEDSKQCSEG